MHGLEGGVIFCTCIAIVMVVALYVTIWLDITARREKERQRDERLKESLEAGTTSLKHLDKKLGKIVETLQPSLAPPSIDE